MFEDLTAERRRQILLASRIRFTPEVEVPRQKAIEKMIETALFVAPENHWSTATEIMDAFAQIGALKTIQIRAVVESLNRLAVKQRVEIQKAAPQFRYRLMPSACEEIRNEFIGVSGRLDRVLMLLYNDVVGDKDPRTLAPFFLEVICDFFSHLGVHWADHLIANGRNQPPVSLEAVQRLVANKIEQFDFDKAFADGIARRTTYFFQKADPDFDYLKFSLGQSFYVARLLGMEGKDYLSEDIFSGKTFYLDSSVIVAALLSSSRHFEVFQQVQKLCKRLGIKLCVARPTVDEVRNVAAIQEQEAPKLYDKVPQSLRPQVRSDFFQSYASLKENNPEAHPEEVFAPFHNLSDTIRTKLSIDVIDDAAFESILDSPDLQTIKNEFQKASQSIRRKAKGDRALTHDATIFTFFKSLSHDSPDQTWFITRDGSLPSAWSALPDSNNMRALLLDSLLQYICPFVLTEDDGADFSEVFSRAIASQLLPQARLFDIEDFMLFQDIELDCSLLTDDEVQEGLLRVKRVVLHGAAYRHEDFGPAAYELRRYFTGRKDRHNALTAETQRLEMVINALQEKMGEREKEHAQELVTLGANHSTEIKGLEERLNEMEGREQSRVSRTAKMWLLARKAFSLALLASLEWIVYRTATKYGVGDNTLVRIVSFSFYFGLAGVVWLVCIKLTLFRKEKLKDVFATWAEAKELFPGS